MRPSKYILISSKRMTVNKKPDRNEHALFRCRAPVRKALGVDVDDVIEVEITGKNNLPEIYKFNVYIAFPKDIKTVRHLVSTGKLSNKDSLRTFFVTERIFKRFGGTADDAYIEVSVAKEKSTILSLGCDPEFLLYKDDGIIPAFQVAGISRQTKIGSDGAMAELRPDPTIEPAGLVQNIRDLFTNERHTSKIKPYSWVASAFVRAPNRDFPVGGHIHVGSFSAEIGKRPLAPILNKVLDDLLAVPFSILEGENGIKRRSISNMGVYGRVGGFRSSGARRFEYRTLSGLWLSHPDLSNIIFRVTAAISKHFLTSIKEMRELNKSMVEKLLYNLREMDEEDWKKIPVVREMRSTIPSQALIKILETGKLVIGAKELTGWYKKVKTLMAYKEDSEAFDKLYGILNKALKDKKVLDNADIKAAWVENQAFSF